MFEDSPLRTSTAFRRLWLVGLAFRLATGLRRVAVPWLVLEVTGSPLHLGVALAFGSVDVLFAPVLGAVVDRFSRRRQVAASLVGYGLVLAILPLAARAGALSVGLIYAVLGVTAVLHFAYYNARHALVPELVDDLDGANATIHGTGAALSLAFVAAGGALTALVGPLETLAIAAAGALVAPVALIGVPEARPDPRPDAQPVGSAVGTVLADLRTGARAVRGTVVRDVVAVSVAINLVMPAFGLLFAALGHEAFGSAVAYTALLVAFDGGKLAGNLGVTRLPWSRDDLVSRGVLLSGGLALLVGLLAAVLVGALAPRRALAGLAVAVVGLGAVQPLFNVPADSLVQAAVDDADRGKVLTLTNALIQLPFPVAYLAGGWVVDRTDPAVGFGLAGAVLVAVGVAARGRFDDTLEG